MGVVWKEAGETSIRAPIGRVAKCDDEAPSRVDTSEGPVARTGRKCASFAESEVGDEGGNGQV